MIHKKLKSFSSFSSKAFTNQIQSTNQPKMCDNNKCGSFLCFACNDDLKTALKNAQNTKNEEYYEEECKQCFKIKQVMYSNQFDIVVCDGCFGEKYCSCLYCGEFKIKDTICDCEEEEITVKASCKNCGLFDGDTDKEWKCEIEGDLCAICFACMPSGKWVSKWDKIYDDDDYQRCANCQDNSCLKTELNEDGWCGGCAERSGICEECDEEFDEDELKFGFCEDCRNDCEMCNRTYAYRKDSGIYCEECEEKMIEDAQKENKKPKNFKLKITGVYEP
jgi:hypothetical protein